jgi:hypothetical protein
VKKASALNYLLRREKIKMPMALGTSLVKLTRVRTISVTTGKKVEVNRKPHASNVIPGFGYAVMDIFENEFVDMASIVKKKDHVEEEKSPFKSPNKRSPSKPRDSSITKDEYRR